MKNRIIMLSVLITSGLLGYSGSILAAEENAVETVSGSNFVETMQTTINDSGEYVVSPITDIEALTYESAAELLAEMLHLSDKTENYEDVPDASEYAGAIGALEDAGILFEDSEKFGYGKYITPEKMTTISEQVSTFLTTQHDSYEVFKAASLQFNPEMYQLDSNVDAMLVEVEKLFQDGVKLIVAPEMSTTGYSYTSREDIDPYLDTIPGNTTDRFAELTEKYDGYIVFGMPELDPQTNSCYNAAALVGPEGYIGKYRKTHQWETEEHWSAWGNLGVPVYRTDIGNIAINICMDSAYYESARLAAINGADILAFPTNSTAQAIAALPARAMQNGMYVVSANRSNTELGFHMLGASAIWSPMGDKIQEAPLIPTTEEDVNEATAYTGEIDPVLYNNENKDRLAERTPQNYYDVILKAGPWDYTASTESQHVKAAALQYEPSADPEENKAKIRSLMEHADQVNLVVLPELSLTGIVNENVTANSEDALAFATELAQKYSTAIIIGAVEEKEGNLYNASLLIDKNGDLVGTYRKVHLNTEEKAWATPGDAFEVFTVEGLGKIGMLIGDDVCFPEAAGVLSVNRADIIAIPSAWSGQFGGFIQINENMSANKFPSNTMVLWDAVSEGAEAYTITANYVGTDKNYLGSSALNTLDPLYALDQPVTASETEEEALCVEFDTIRSDGWYNQNMLVNSRRTDFYYTLIQ